MKKRALLLLAIGLVVFLSACSGGEADTAASHANQEGTAGQASDSGQKTTLEIWHYYGSGDAQKLLSEKIDEYNKMQDKVSLTAQYIPYQDMMQQISVATVGNSLPDMILLDTVWNSSVAALGKLEDLTDRIEEWGEADQFHEGPLSSALYQDRYYGLPFTSNFGVLYYNKDLLKDAGIDKPPTTWDELRADAKQLTNDQHAGFALSLSKSENGTFAFLPFVLSAGASYKNLDSSEADKALSFLVQLMDDGSISKDLINLPQDDVTKRFASGQVAMMLNGSWDIGTVQQLNPQMNFGIAFIPKDKQFASTTGGENWTIVHGDHADSAWEFMKWMERPELLADFNTTVGNIPPRKDVTLKLEDKPRLQEAMPIVEVVTPRGPSPHWPEISEAIQIAMQKALTKNATPQEALKEAAQKISEIEK